MAVLLLPPLSFVLFAAVVDILHLYTIFTKLQFNKYMGVCVCVCVYNGLWTICARKKAAQHSNISINTFALLDESFSALLPPSSPSLL